MDKTNDTIFALSTAPGRAGVAVIRLSGPQATEIAGKISRSSLSAPRVMAVRKLWDGDDLLDECMIVWFEEGKSFTSEIVAELHLHGGRATVGRVLSLLGSFEHARAASPGEFTRRALEGGRLDLIEVEALGDLIDAETEEQRRQAMELMNGGAGGQTRDWRRLVVRAYSLLEASIDFADEEDAPADVEDEVKGLIKKVHKEMKNAVQGSAAAKRVRDGFRIALIGAPNSGKSTLMNTLVKRQAAITSPIAGTTRDVIEVAADFKGFPVVLQDTAGLRTADDEVERLGVELAKTTAAAADLRLFLSSKDARAEDDWIDRRPGDLQIWSKADLHAGKGDFVVSSVTGEGIEELIDGIVEKLQSGRTSSGLFGRERQIKCLGSCVDSLERAMMADMPELAVAELRQGVSAMDELFGDIGVEEVLGEIFSNFCIGK